MEPQESTPLSASSSKSTIEETGMTKLTALELNNIKLDPKHTLLTPDYLQKLIEGKEKT